MLPFAAPFQEVAHRDVKHACWRAPVVCEHVHARVSTTWHPGASCMGGIARCDNNFLQHFFLFDFVHGPHRDVFIEQFVFVPAGKPWLAKHFAIPATPLSASTALSSALCARTMAGREITETPLFKRSRGMAESVRLLKMYSARIKRENAPLPASPVHRHGRILRGQRGCALQVQR